MIGVPLMCQKCNSELVLHHNKLSCECMFSEYDVLDDIFVRKGNCVNIEATVRNQQAKGYLQHSKFPTQLSNFTRWLSKLPTPKDGEIALDLGCGSGPYTQLLLNKGYSVVAIDFSIESILINRNGCSSKIEDKEKLIFIQDDLNNLNFQNESCSIVVMADFLQHLGNRENRERLLFEAFSALESKGKFYLSFFNINIKNYLKGDKRMCQQNDIG